MRKLLSAGAMFVAACSARTANDSLRQPQPDPATAGLDGGAEIQPPANTPSDASDDSETSTPSATLSAAPARRICDGSDGIRLAHWVGGGGPQPAFTAVLTELGWAFLYVDGHCHYWVAEPSSGAGPYREGVLMANQESALHDLVSYDDFARAAPPCPHANGGISDASTEALWDGVTMHSCNAGWQVGLSWPMRSELFASGTPMTGAMRVEVGQDALPGNVTIYPWPLTASPASYEVPYSKSWITGQSALVTDPIETAALRRLLNQAIPALLMAGYGNGLIPVLPKGYLIGIRDDLPFTRRSDGLWSAP